jgi:hypothetical protein
LRGDIVDVDESHVVNFLQPMIDDVDVFGALLKDWIGCQGNVALVVDVDFKSFGECDVAGCE